MSTSSAMSTTNTYIKYKITVTTNSQSTTNNTSNVTVSVKFYRTNTGYTTYGSGTVYCVIDGTTYSQSVDSSDKITSSGIVLFKKTLTISHDDDGDKSLTCKAKISHSQFSSSYQSYTVSLTTIPRKSTLSCSAMTMASASTITVTRKSSSFTHTIKYTVGSTTVTIATKSSSTSISYTPPISTWIGEYDSSTSLTGTMKITTYSGSTSIGTNSYNVKLSVPSSVVPTINSVTFTDNNSYAKALGVYVSGYTNLTIATSASTYGSANSVSADGSSISSRVTTLNSTSYSGSSVKTGVLSLSGTYSAVTKVTDSRSRSASKTTSLTFYSYSAPSISSVSVYRCDSDGTSDDDGTYVHFSITWSITSLNSTNSAKIKIVYAEGTSSTTSTLVSSTSLSGTSGTYTATKTITDGFDVDNSYQFVITITDAMNQSVSSNQTVSTSFTLVNYRSTGKGMAIGKKSERNAFEVGMDEYITSTYLGVNNTGGSPTTGSYLGGLYNAGSYTRTWVGTADSTVSNRMDIYPSYTYFPKYIQAGSYILATGFRASQSNINGCFRLVDSSNLHGIHAGYNEDYNRVYISHVDYTDSSTANTDNWYSSLLLNESTTRVTQPFIVPASNNYGCLRDSNGVSLIGTSTSGDIYIGSDSSSYSTGNTNIYSYTGYVSLESTSPVRVGRVSTSNSAKIRMGSDYSQEAGLSCYFSDSSVHNLIYRASSSNYCYFGYYSSSITTRAYIRGTAVYYTNSSGSTSLSDRNLKEDIEEYSDEYDTFFDSLIPRTFKYIQGQSGRTHAGFVTQEVEEALETAGLTTQEFAGVNIHSVEREQEEIEVQIGTETIESEDDESDEITITEHPIYERQMVDLDDSAANYLLDQGIDEEHDLIYTEFISLNTWQIQKLKSRVSALETENAGLKATIEAQQATIDAILEKIGGIE